MGIVTVCPILSRYLLLIELLFLMMSRSVTVKKTLTGKQWVIDPNYLVKDEFKVSQVSIKTN